MNSRIAGLKVAAIFFGLFCLAHVWRLLAKIDVVIAGRHVPSSASVIAIVIAGGLSLWMWKLSGAER